VAATGVIRTSERVSIRVGASLLSNVARLVLSFTAGLLIARGLGASRYGEYQFLLASVASLSQFIDFGTSQAFFTFVARHRRHRRFLTIYSGWLALQFVVVVVAVGALAPAPMIATLWVGERRTAILLAFAATFLMNEVWEAVSQLGEARRRTVVVQAALTIQAAAHVTLVAWALYLHRLTVTTVFVFLIVEYGALVLTLGPAFVRLNVAAEPESDVTVRSVFKEFWLYCRPLITYSLFGFVIVFADRWLLQRFGGASQQGFFAIGQQFSTISLLATTSILQVFWTEVAAASAIGDRQRVALLFRSTSRALYFMAAWIACLLMPYAREILTITVGIGYAGAAASFALMLVYPIHQSMGRICGSLMQAAGETQLYSQIGMATMVLSLPITYLLLAPHNLAVPGLALGALGLAMKTVIIGVLSVNLLAYAISARLGAPYDWKHQVATLGLLLLLAFGCRYAVQQMIEPSPYGRGLVAIALGALAYVVASATVVYRRPGVVGLTRAQVASVVGVYRGLLAS
jgi:O-antigen/teichoic acid export membrane protein